MSTLNYFEYVNQCLGVRSFILPPPNLCEDKELNYVPSENDIEAKNQTNLNPSLENLIWENETIPTGKVPLLFIRVTSEEKPALMIDSESFNLFENLRKALEFNSESAPYVEVPETQSEKFYTKLIEISEYCILMSGRKISNQGSFMRDWIIPDPSQMVDEPQLKRPTWDLLKGWKNLIKAQDSNLR